jgi:hypothetical protein
MFSCGDYWRGSPLFSKSPNVLLALSTSPMQLITTSMEMVSIKWTHHSSPKYNPDISVLADQKPVGAPDGRVPTTASTSTSIPTSIFHCRLHPNLHPNLHPSLRHGGGCLAFPISAVRRINAAPTALRHSWLTSVTSMGCIWRIAHLHHTSELRARGVRKASGIKAGDTQSTSRIEGGGARRDLQVSLGSSTIHKASQ